MAQTLEDRNLWNVQRRKWQRSAGLIKLQMRKKRKWLHQENCEVDYGKSTNGRVWVLRYPTFEWTDMLWRLTNCRIIIIIKRCFRNRCIVSSKKQQILCPIKYYISDLPRIAFLNSICFTYCGSVSWNVDVVSALQKALLSSSQNIGCSYSTAHSPILWATALLWCCLRVKRLCFCSILP